MSAHPAPCATRSIRAETAGTSGPALGPNQRGKAGGEVEASIPVMAMATRALEEGSAGEHSAIGHATFPATPGSAVPAVSTPGPCETSRSAAHTPGGADRPMFVQW